MPFTATSVSQAAAIASMDAADELLARTDAVVAERAQGRATALRDAGFTVPPSQANFVWLPLAERTDDFVNSAADNRLLVRPYGQDGVRVTVAAPHENDAFLDIRHPLDLRRERMSRCDARKTFAAFTERDEQIPDAELDAFWATLEPPPSTS